MSFTVRSAPRCNLCTNTRNTPTRNRPPRTNQWMFEKYPSLHQQIVDRVKEGRWEMVGGMWVEPDLNMPDGESLVRQLLIGKRYFKEKFGADVRIGWNPDSFGYNWQLSRKFIRSPASITSSRRR